MIKWHKEKISAYPKWYAEINSNIVAGAVMTGRQGVDNYPWDWYTDNDAGVSDTLEAAKSKVEQSLKDNITPRNCPLQNDWRNWSEDKKRDRLFMICPACGVVGFHVRI